MAVNSGLNATLSENQNNGHSNLNFFHNVIRQDVSFLQWLSFLICKMGTLSLLCWVVMKMKGRVCKMAKDSDWHTVRNINEFYYQSFNM